MKGHSLTIDVLLDDMTDDCAPEAVLYFVALVPGAFGLIDIVLDLGKEVCGSRVAGPKDSLGWASA
jgi:hypothetical protein